MRRVSPSWMNVSPVCGSVNVLSPVRSSGKPERPTHLIRRAGTPATSAKSGTSLVTTEPAATVAQRPTVTGATHTARAPMAQPSRSVTPTGSQSWALFGVPSGLMARGNVSLVSTAAGPTNTPSSRCAGS